MGEKVGRENDLDFAPLAEHLAALRRKSVAGERRSPRRLIEQARESTPEK
jgi:hypothetical protein